MADIWRFENCSSDFMEKEKIYTSMLLDYTKIHNITALKNQKEVIENIKDSIYPKKYINLDIKSVADVGSGAGFPAIHLALVLKHLHFTLYEPIKKKSAFLHLIRAKLGLSNVEISSKRVEFESEKKFDLITSRAVTNVDTLLKICKNITHENSHFLLYKGSSVELELSKDMSYDVHKKGDRRYIYIKDFH